MWLFTTIGFFSAVEHREMRSCLLVRCRVREDAERLIDACNTRSPEVIETPDADYPYRVIVSKREFAMLIADLITDTDYDNFKAEISCTDQGVARARLYGNVWGILHDAEAKLEKYEGGAL